MSKSYKWVCNKERNNWLKNLNYKGIQQPMNVETKKVKDPIWDMPLEYDPWAQAVIDVAVESGGLDIHTIASVMDMNPTQINEIEIRALRKLYNNSSAEERLSIKTILSDVSVNRDNKEITDFSSEAD